MLEIVYINFYGYTLYNQSFYITANNIQLKNDKSLNCHLPTVNFEWIFHIFRFIYSTVLILWEVFTNKMSCW